MKIYSNTPTRDPLDYRMMQKSLSEHIWVKIKSTPMNLQITGSWYIQVISLVKPDVADTAKKFFRVMCRCIPANLVDDYDFEGEEIYPSDSIDIRDLLSWTFDVVSPVEMYTEDEMDEQLARSDAEFEQGYFDWWGVAPRRPREE